MWIDEFNATLKFELDDFQKEAIRIIDAGDNVLVGAPTGAGKTIVGDAGIFYWMNTSETGRIYYTTPIKALSNQKFRELGERYGVENVGLITGDVVMNSDARIVVMTTEVLRNQVYSHSNSLTNLQCVVMDEVHFLGDRGRGSVWEEVIINLPQHINIIALSATVSNIEEFASWMQQVRGHCQVVVTEKRPVPLVQHMILSSDEKPNSAATLYDVYKNAHGGGDSNAQNHGRQLNQSLMQKMIKPMAAPMSRKPRGRRGGGRSFPNASKTKGLRKIPGRVAIVNELRKKGILPAIYFIFSRKGCDEAVDQILHSDIMLNDYADQDEIAFVVDTMIAGRIAPEDLRMLDFGAFKQSLMQGVAAHHAGLLPVYKEIVEHLFERGLLKLVFATETLALGINMPARSVVIERLTKYDGVGHTMLTPGQFTQLTGRAGRRGLDDIGHAVVVDGRNLRLPEVAALSSKRVYPLRSAFSPSYNMAVNLASTYDNHYVEDILRNSFAQFQLDQKSREFETRISEYNHLLNGYQKEIENDTRKASMLKNRVNKLKSRKRDVEKSLLKNRTLIVDRYYRIVDILLHFDYLWPHDGELTTTARGDLLKNFYCEYELVFVEAIYTGLFQSMSPAELTAAISCFVSLSKSAQSDRLDNPQFEHMGAPFLVKMNSLQNIYKDVKAQEKTFKISNDEDFGLNFGMLEVAYRWGSGESFARTIAPLGDARMGDFIRLSRGVMDILQQVIRYMGDKVPDNAQNCMDILRNSFVAGLLD
ncbi:MAG: DEAD/DEAH box helicase [Candidatus Ancillula sp.]|jgi:ATP-dependent RNA helicase HelY|nr:DEAD/DEAH box helicase [Candidatus Ancillula sp.]